MPTRDWTIEDDEGGWEPMPPDAPFRCQSCPWYGSLADLGPDGECPDCEDPNGPEPLSKEACPECGGKTIEFRGTRLDLQFKLCSKMDEPGHLTWQQCWPILRKMRDRHAPASGRYS